MTVITASTSQQNLVVANSSRKGLQVFNQSAAPMYVSTVNGFARANAPIVIPAGERWTMPLLYTGPFYCSWPAATGQAQVTEV